VKEKKTLETKTEATAAPAASTDGLITIDDFTKVELRLGLVVSAEPVPKSKKLLKLQVDIGEATPRQILAGIAEHYTAEGLVGKKLVIVANLAPRAMMGQESHGMVLAASDADGLSVLGVEKDIKPGVRVK
jgi:methionyl-tRNA synthetase